MAPRKPNKLLRVACALFAAALAMIALIYARAMIRPSRQAAIHEAAAWDGGLPVQRTTSFHHPEPRRARPSAKDEHAYGLKRRRAALNAAINSCYALHIPTIADMSGYFDTRGGWHAASLGFNSSRDTSWPDVLTSEQRYAAITLIEASRADAEAQLQAGVPVRFPIYFLFSAMLGRACGDNLFSCAELMAETHRTSFLTHDTEEVMYFSKGLDAVLLEDDHDAAAAQSALMAGVWLAESRGLERARLAAQMLEQIDAGRHASRTPGNTMHYFLGGRLESTARIVFAPFYRNAAEQLADALAFGSDEEISSASARLEKLSAACNVRFESEWPQEFHARSEGKSEAYYLSLIVKLAAMRYTLRHGAMPRSFDEVVDFLPPGFDLDLVEWTFVVHGLGSRQLLAVEWEGLYPPSKSWEPVAPLWFVDFWAQVAAAK